MEQLANFKRMLHEAGYNWQCNYTVKNKRTGEVLERYTIYKGGGSIQVIFQLFANNKGFTHYIESVNVNMAECLNELNALFDA